MAVFTTDRGTPVDHFHVTAQNDIGPKIVQDAQDWMKRNHPRAFEVKVPTCKYGCHGYAFANRHGYFNFADQFIEDDYEDINMSDAQIGDVLIYTKIIKGRREITHSAKVTEVEDEEIIEVRSKWGGMAEVLHAPDDTPRDAQGRRRYGRPTRLLRKLVNFVPLDAELGVSVMRDEKTTRATIDRALEQLLDPDVYLLPMLASTPAVREEIIESLPGIQELIDIGPEGGAAALDLFQREETQSNHLISNIALYLLQRIPTTDAAEPLARFLRRRAETIQCGDLALAARAFLVAKGLEARDADFMSLALEEAKKYE